MITENNNMVKSQNSNDVSKNNNGYDEIIIIKKK